MMESKIDSTRKIINRYLIAFVHVSCRFPVDISDLLVNNLFATYNSYRFCEAVRFETKE